MRVSPKSRLPVHHLVSTNDQITMVIMESDFHPLHYTGCYIKLYHDVLSSLFLSRIFRSCSWPYDPAEILQKLLFRRI
jgi:hypothetical protein